MSSIILEGLVLAGGGTLGYDLVDGKIVVPTKVVFGGDGQVVSAWSHGAGVIDDGTPRVCLPSDQLSTLATEANQATANGHLATLAGAVAAARVQADVLSLPALPAGTNNIGDVDVLTMPGTAASGAALPDLFNAMAGVDSAGNAGAGAVRPWEMTSEGEGLVHVQNLVGVTQWAVDDALGAAPEGDLALARRVDVLSTLTPVDGDAVDLRVNSLGALWCATVGGALANGQVAVDTTAGGTEIVAASPGRRGVLLTNMGPETAYIGTGTVTTTNGFPLHWGESVHLPTDSGVKGVTESGSATIAHITTA